MKPNENLKEYKLCDLEYYKILGRTDKTQYPLPLFWHGSAIEVNVTGTELWIDVEVDFDSQEPWIATYINNVQVSRQMLTAGRHKICLFRSLSSETVKNIRFSRETQALSGDPNCHLLVHSFSSDGFFLPVSENALKLEFIGDSITSGEGTYGAHEETDWCSMWMSFSHTYGSMISADLDADYSIVSQGGWGVLSSWDNDPHCNIPSIYEKICGVSADAYGAQKPYDFNSFKPDAIIVNLGTNDASAFEQPAHTDPVTGEIFNQLKNPDGTYEASCLERFEQAVIAFLKMIRKHNETSKIVWVYGMLGYNLTLPIADAITRYSKETGDYDVSFLQAPNTTKETVGSLEHPGLKSHERAAGVLMEYLKDLLSL